MKKKFESLGQALLKPVNKAAIILLGLYTVMWGAWVANPFWSVFSQSQLFSALGLVAPEVFWGCLAIFCGIVISRGAVRRSYRSLIIGASVAWAHWLTIAIFYFLGDWQNTGGITCLFISMYAAFIWLNVKVNHKHNHRSMREILR